ncbi:MAG TPA: sn-glycerol-3-phosphate ABC transporter ATP-binding protein UgpC [Negativicutes bacterium]|nr:sn-glycerol-3-phosphate ABC transporter ATP-binding protein UgpC [Negativicutes bacterium]
MMGKVVLEHVTKKFGHVTAVNDFNIEIDDNEFIVIVGPSGCGKSTVLRMIAGLEMQTSGNINIAGDLVNNKPPRDRNIAMVFQNYALYPHMNVYENMAFGLSLHGMPKDQIDVKVKEAAEILSINELLNRKPKELSGGQRQRVALGRAIVREPEVFLMDEPLSNLDAKLRVQTRAEISKLHARLNVTTIYVTHDQIEAMTMADRIVVIKDGIIQQVADPQTLYDAPANQFVAGFIGTPPMNFFRCHLVKKDGTLHLKANGIELPISSDWMTSLESFVDQELILGVRPENAEICDSATGNIKAVVDVVEPMGSETYLHLNIGGQKAIIRVAPDCRPMLGATVGLSANLERIHLFRTDTGETLIK